MVARGRVDYPSLGSYDVVVCGGGPAGCVAAVAAGRAGARVLLVEQYGFLGGALTAQGVHPMMTFHAGPQQVVRGIADEVVERLKAAGASPGHIADSIGYASSVTPFDLEGLKCVLEELVDQAGVEVLYHAMLADAWLEDGVLGPALLCTKAGLMVANGRVFVEATGDGDLLARAGIEFLQGRAADGATQPMTTNFRVGQVDVDRVRAYVLSHPDEFWLDGTEAVQTAARLSVSGFYEHVRRGKAAGEFPNQRRGVLFFETNTPGEVNVNTTHIIGRDATDPRQLSAAETEGRTQARAVFAFLKARVPGFERAVYLNTGFQIGVRESRRLRGCYCLTERDLVEGQRFADTIAVGGYPVDIHPPTPADAAAAAATGKQAHSIAKGRRYYLPYRCLITAQCRNLVVAGRCLSADHEALGAVRVTPIAMATGQAAGTAAALAARATGNVHQVDPSQLQQVLRTHGAELG